MHAHAALKTTWMTVPKGLKLSRANYAMLAIAA